MIKFGQSVKLGEKGQEVIYLRIGDVKSITIDADMSGVNIETKSGEFIFVNSSNIAYFIYERTQSEKSKTEKNADGVKEEKTSSKR